MPDITPKFLITLLLALSFSVVTRARADTIYLCRSFNSESFWSSNHCQNHKALVEGIYTVPNNMPFQQQADLAQRGVERAKNARIAEGNAQMRAAKCGSINWELEQLQKKYTSWQYVPIDQVNADQEKERVLKSRRNSLGC